MIKGFCFGGVISERLCPRGFCPEGGLSRHHWLQYRPSENINGPLGK